MEGIKLFIINSKDRLPQSISSTNAVFQFNAFNATSVEVVSLQMPATMYNITSINNIVYFNDGVVRNFAIPVGNYSVYDFIVALQTGFNSVSANYVVTYSNVSMKINITGLLAFRLLFGTYNVNSASYIMGFNAVDSGTALISQTSNNCIDLSLPLYICCDIPEFNTNTKSTNDSSSSFVFPNAVNGGDIISYSEMSDYKQCSVISLNFIQNIHVRFTIPGNYDLDINNSDWIMVVRLHYCHC